MSSSDPARDLRARAGALRRRLLPELLTRMSWSAQRLAAFQELRLRGLLAHAARHSPFHAQRLRGIDPATFALQDLAQLPTMDKTLLMDNFDAVLCDRALDLARAERTVAATTTEPLPLPGDRLVLASGGSSGRPGLFVMDLEASIETSCAATRHLAAHMLARPPGGAIRFASIHGPSATHGTALGAALSRDSSASVQVLGVPVSLPLGQIVDRLNDFDPHYLVAYPTVLAQLAEAQTAGHLRLKPQLLVSATDMLSTQARACIQAAIDTPIMDLYGTTEGLMGATEPDGTLFTFSTDTCIVEPVDEHDRPVPPGTASTSVLITNLCNRVQPLLRYRLEDRFTCLPADADGRLRATVQGREPACLRYGALEVHAISLRGVLLTSPGLSDYQIRQTRRGVAVRVLCRDKGVATALQAKVRASLIHAGLADPEVKVERVEALDADPRSGKIRRFVPLVE